MYREDILHHAYELARANDGAPGVDGESFEDIESRGLAEWMNGLRKDLRNKTYRPQPVGRVTSKTRTTLRDPEAWGRGATVRDTDGQRELHSIAIRIWDGRRSAIRSIRFAASASKF